MSDNMDILKAIHAKDQRSGAEKERDLAIAKCAMHTANHYLYLTKQGLPADLVARLTEAFHYAYLQSVIPQPIVATSTWTSISVDDDGTITPGGVSQ